MYPAHADEVALDGIDVAGQVEGQERDVDIFPADRFDQIE